MKLVVILAAVLTTLSVSAWADTPEERLEQVLDAFEDSALWSGNYHQVATVVVRWTQPIRVSVDGSPPDNIRTLALDAIHRLGAITHTAVEVLPPEAGEGNFVLSFANNDTVYSTDGARGWCMTTPEYRAKTGLTHVKTVLDMWGPDFFKVQGCIRHEIMHGMGLSGHPHRLDSVLSYVYRREDYTEDDVLLLELLYALKPGLYHFPALMAVREELGRRLGIAPEVAATLGGKVFEKELKRAAEAAENGNAAMQVQLGAAYFFGQYLERQPERGVDLFRRAAEQGDSDGQFRLAYAIANGRGAARNIAEAARLYEQAARKGHPVARDNLGVFYRDGRLGPGDPVAAWALFDLAAGQGYAKAARHRDALAVSEGQKEQARQRQAEWSEAAK